jgi:hypothetical protein
MILPPQGEKHFSGLISVNITNVVVGGVLTSPTVPLPLPFFHNPGSQSNIMMHAGVPSLKLKRTEREADHSYLVSRLLMDRVLRLLSYEIL